MYNCLQSLCRDSGDNPVHMGDLSVPWESRACPRSSRNMRDPTNCQGKHGKMTSKMRGRLCPLTGTTRLEGQTRMYRLQLRNELGAQPECGGVGRRSSFSLFVPDLSQVPSTSSLIALVFRPRAFISCRSRLPGLSANCAHSRSTARLLQNEIDLASRWTDDGAVESTLACI